MVYLSLVYCTVEKAWDEGIGKKSKVTDQRRSAGQWDGTFDKRNFSLSALQSTSLHSLGPQGIKE